MAVDPTSSATGATSNSGNTAALTRSSSIDYDSFLKLLVAEMANQDPTSPMKSSEYVAQLASFSGVEQAIQTNSKLDSLLSSAAFGQTSSVIGRTVVSADGLTSGVAVAVRVGESASTAILEDGSEVPLGAGVVIK